MIPWNNTLSNCPSVGINTLNSKGPTVHKVLNALASFPSERTYNP